jgi:hypothetical protein
MAHAVLVLQRGNICFFYRPRVGLHTDHEGRNPADWSARVGLKRRR